MQNVNFIRLEHYELRYEFIGSYVMTIDEFNNTGFGGGMFAMYKGKKFPIFAVAFDEALIALDGVVQGSEHPHWVRCENIELTDDHT